MQDKILNKVMDALSEGELDEILKGINMENLQESNINKDKIKQNTMRKINKHRKKGFSKSKIIAATVAALFIIGISPLGNGALAAVREKMYFVEGKGMVATREGEELYTLKEPIKAIVKGETILVRSIVAYKDKLEVRRISVYQDGEWEFKIN